MKQKDPLIAGLFVFRLSEITGYPFAQERERVNRYTVNFVVMLTSSATYGKMFLDRKGCGRRWIEALKERGYGWRLRVVCDWQQK